MDQIEFVGRLEACTLPPEHFNLAGHVRLACHYLAQHSLEEAIVRTCATIRSYATHLGAADKYHATITVALVRLLRAHGSPIRAASPQAHETFLRSLGLSAPEIEHIRSWSRRMGV